MSKFQRLDIILEISELGQDLLQEIKQQLIYYKASVYKNETAELISQKITALHTLLILIPMPALHEPFEDFQAEQCNGLSLVPGECLFSARVGRLLTQLEKNLQMLQEKGMDRDVALANQRQSLEQKVYENRRKILDICQPGTRSWDFFHSLAVS